MWQCSICTHVNTTDNLSCELCGVLRDLSLYFNNISEAEDGAKCRHKYSGVSILARSLFTPSSTKSKAIVFSDGFEDSRNTAGNKQATMDALHKTYMTRKKRHINIVPFKFDTPSPDDMVVTGLKSSRNFRKEVLVKDSVDVTGKDMTDNDILLTEKSTSMDPSASVQLDEVGGTISNVPSSSQNITLVLDHKLQHLSLERKPKNSKPNIKKAASVSHYKPEPWMLQSEDQEIRKQLSLAIVGHVDSGKSTLCGRLRHALGLISKKQMHKYEKEAKEKGKGSFAYAWAMDESSDERERGITMTVAVAYFNSENYRVVLLDSPGHKDFVPNMISGATQADAAILVVDASIGSFEAGMGVNGIGQTKEHSQLIRSFGVENLIVAINKMDVVEYSKERFQSIKSQLGIFLRSCGYKDSSVTWVPLSAMANENLVTASSDSRLLSWYNGDCLLKAIDSLPPPHRDVSRPLRLPICDVIASHTLGQVAVCGKVESGGIRTGSKVLAMPSGDIATVRTIERDSSTCNLARAGDNVAIGLHGIDPGHIVSGGVLCHPDFPVHMASHLELKILVLEITTPILVGVQSLSGHTSAVESVGFDSTEVFVAAGAASGTIKLWDLEEAKIVRTLTGHRSNCMSVDFHPFGEFFASGSLDTNLKIWDIRRKNCIHTYKGHTRGVNAIRFTPDGRWVVSGGEDNIVKLWDLTAGKLLHEFKCHDGQIQCIDFHPHEFLLATGSADKTVKFWDLETFELIGSTGPETTGVRSMTFNPDGRSLLCGLHESLKVFSWEPIRCHDTVDVGWSRLADLNVHEGKLLGCSFNQSCVGIWVVDLTRLEPYATGTSTKLNGHSELKTVSSGAMPLQNDSGSRANIGRPSVLQNSENNLKTSSGRLSASQNSDSAPKETKSAPSSGLVPSTPQRAGVSSNNRSVGNSAFQSGGTTLKRSSLRSNSASNVHSFGKADVVPVIVPRNSSGGELTTDSRSDAADVAPVLPKVTRRVDPATDSRKESNDVEPVIPRASSRMEIASDSAPISTSKSGRRLESAPDSKKESADTAPVVVSNPRANVRMEMASDSAPAVPRSNRKLDSGTDSKKESADAVPVIVPRTNSRMEMISDSRREPSAGRVSPFRIQSRYAELRKLTHAKTDSNKVDSGSKITETDDFNCQIFLPHRNGVFQTISSEESREDVKCGPVDRMGFSNSSEPNASVRSENYVSRMRKPRDNCYIEVSRAGRARSSVSNWEGRDQSPSHEEPTTSSSSLAPTGRPYSSRGSNQKASETPIVASDEDVLSLIMEQHDLFLSSTKSRLTKLQIIHQMWERNDIRGVLSAMERMGDHAVCADMASVLMERSEIITLDLCTSILPVVTDLLESKTDRHLGVALELLVKLVRTFGPMIHSTVSSGPCVGVDLEAEQRRERCNLCFIELEKAKNKLPSLTRRKGAVANAAQELARVFQEIMS